MTNAIELFLQGAHIVLEAIGDDAVAAAWDAPSVLEEQAVSSLAGHLARGGVWVVDDYLDAAVSAGEPDFASAADYYAGVLPGLTEDEHRAIRERGATIGAMGQDELVTTLAERLSALGTRLRSEPADRLLAVIGGRTIRFDHYLATRIVEQAVHLDDLGRSVGRTDGWPVLPEAQALVIAVGMDIATRHHGAPAVVRALYRRGFAESVLPVL